MMVHPDSHEVSRASRYSGTVFAAFETTYGTFTLYGQVSQPVLLSNCGSSMTALQPRMVETTRFGLFPFRSPLLRESRLISSPAGTEMFHFPAFAFLSLCIGLKNDWINPAGLPHSDTSGSKPAWRLAGEFRCLPRPSSPPGAKASTRCP